MMAARSYITPVIALYLLLGSLGCTRHATETSDGRSIVRLQLLLISAKQVEHYRWVEETFEARNPDVDVQFEQFPGSSLKDFEIKLKLSLASKTAPDVVGVGFALAEELARLEYLAVAPEHIVQRISSAATSNMVETAPCFGDVCYGIVSDATPTALYYNRDMFAEVGLDPDRPPSTMTELLDFADQLTVRNENGDPIRAGLSLRKSGFKPGITEKWFTFLFSEGGQAFSADGKKAAFNSEAGKRALDLYKKVLFDRKIDSTRLEGDQQGFGQKTAAMFIREVHVIRWLRENYPDLDFGVAPIPRGVTSLSAGSPYMFVVPVDTKKSVEAWRLIDFMMSDEVYSRYASIGGIIPVVKAVAQESRYADDPMMSIFVNQEMETVRPFPRFYQVTDVLGAYLERFCYGQISAEEALDRAEKDINALLATVS